MGSSDGKTGRRGFLKAAGFTLAGVAASNCARAPVNKAIPFLVQPEEITPGNAYFYASTCAACSAGCGLLVKNMDGRPIKLEGNPDHPISKGGLCAVGQASILGLYDSHRLAHPTRDGQAATWAAVDDAIRAQLADIESSGGAVRMLTGTITSPTERGVIDEFLSRFADAQHIEYDALSSSAILAAHERTHGTRLLPRYRFERAEVIVGLDADFLGTWISPVEYAAGYRAGRSLAGRQPRLSYHAQIESALSLTGGRADRRIRIAPEQMAGVVGYLAEQLSQLAGVSNPIEFGDAPAGIEGLNEQLDDLADRLWRARSRSLVICGSQDIALQSVVNVINHLLEGYGATVDIERPSRQRRGNDSALEQLLADIDRGSVAGLFVAAANPAYDLPVPPSFTDALERVPLFVSFADRLDETASHARYVCPDHHFLESWKDGESVSGVLSLTQPAIRPIGQTRPVVESLSAWLGQPRAAYDMLRTRWQRDVYPGQPQAGSFEQFWDRSVHDGFAALIGRADRTFAVDTRAASAPEQPTAAPNDAFSLVLYAKVGLRDGSPALNPWLQELPDPVSKVTWDNYACLSPDAAARLEVTDGDILRLETVGDSGPAIELPAFIQPGQHDGVVAVALGYGRSGTERFRQIGPQWIEARPGVGADGRVGVNAAGLLALTEGTLTYSARHVRVLPTGRTRQLATTQTQSSISVPAGLAPPDAEPRALVQETTLPAYLDDPSAGIHHHEIDGDMWPADHTYPGHRWAMAIDLGACTGCSACVVACQAENNIAVVGYDEVRRRREMHWLRIDRYYSGSGDDVDVMHQPMLCQHCENAPCEVVCPVLATVHSEEGLNEQIYNRCVGTRYCANNCPYKVRRFNWFQYARPDQMQNLVLNPDVVVRSRGVMEKCSLCVQRIQGAKMDAKLTGEPLRDGAVETACQQSCPSRAIEFGDVNDPDSAVARAVNNPRYYRVLEELNVKPSVGYLTLVRNRPRDEEEEHRG